MIAIVDYGVGNIFSLYSSFKFIDVDVCLTNDIQKIKDSEKIILPGVELPTKSLWKIYKKY